MKNVLIVSLVLAVCGMAHAGILNGDFEDGGNDWNTGGGAIVTDNGPSMPGISCAELDNTSDAGGRDYRSNQFDIAQNVENFLTFDYKTEVGATSKPQVRFRYHNENLKLHVFLSRRVQYSSQVKITNKPNKSYILGILLDFLSISAIIDHLSLSILKGW